MESLYQLLHGSYGYLLIFQILVVTSLFVAFFWMMAQRTKSANYSFANGAAGQSTTALVSSGITPSEYQQLKEKCAKLEEENIKMEALKEEYDGLLQKVKFLESKLLEYEILQEEIGTLGSLKVENEKLKGELQSLQREISGSKGRSMRSTPAMPDIPPPQTEAPKPDLSAIPNMDFSMTNPAPPAVSLEPEIDLSGIDPSAFPAGMDLGLGTPAEESQMPVIPPVPVDEGLEGLLKQIDSLTQNQDK